MQKKYKRKVLVGKSCQNGVDNLCAKQVAKKVATK
jgi:hypothetical protein